MKKRVQKFQQFQHNITLCEIKMKLCLYLLTFLAFTISAQPELEENRTQIFDPNISSPTQVTINTEHIQTKLNATKLFHISNPKGINPVYSIIFETNQTRNCGEVKNVVEKHLGEYIKFENYELGMFDGWPVEISDATYLHQIEEIVILLTNGDLLRSSLNSTIQEPKKVTKYETISYVNSKNSSAVWQLGEYDIFSTISDIFFFRQSQLKKMSFTENTSQRNLKQEWQMVDVEGGRNLKKVLKEKDDLYLLKTDKVKIISSSTIERDFIILEELGEFVEFIDITISNGSLFILDRQNGILIVDIQTGKLKSDPLGIDFQDRAQSIDISGQSILIGYRLSHENYVAELFMQRDVLSSEGEFKLKINKIYYMFRDMTNIVMFDDFALAYSRSQMNLFQHSVNRKGPLTAVQTEFISNSMYPKILDVIPLNRERVKYILVQKNGVFVEFLGDDPSDESKSSAVTLKQLFCTFLKQGKHKVTVNFTGLCDSANTSAMSTYCFKQQTHEFIVHREKERREAQAFNDHLFSVLILIMAFFLVLGGVLVYRRSIVERRNQLLAFQARRQNGDAQRGNSEMIMIA